jgi:REP element-mobilizing transposase RayT
MPRRARIVLDGVPLHIIQRGNNRAVTFFAEDDYLFYLREKGDRPHSLLRKKGTDPPSSTVIH